MSRPEVSDLLRTGLTVRPDEPAVVSASRRWTWRELDAVSRHYAQHLLAAGLLPGDRIASLLPEGDGLVIHYLACLRARFVATPLNYRYTPPEIDHALRVSGARMLVADSGRRGDVAATDLGGRLPLGVIEHGGPGSGTRFEELLAEPAESVPLLDGEPADPAAIFFTSGSTGPAKGVTHTAGSVAALIDSYGEACAIVPDDVVGAFCSLSHIGGFSDLLGGLSRGATVVIPVRLDVESQLRMIREHRPTYGIFLTSNLFTIVRDPRTANGDFASFRLLGTSGDKLPASLQNELTALAGPRINDVYGMTELGTATISPLDCEPRPGSVGRAAPGFDLEIRDGRGQPVAAGVSGRLWVRSQAVMRGYWNDPDSTNAVLVDGWFDTGDVFTRDEQGYLWFQGRQKQLIVHDGSNITPQEVEEALVQHPSVLTAGVIGVPDVVHGENVHAYVELKTGAPVPDPAELVAFARARVGYKAPEEVFVLPAMPFNASGKIDRQALRRLASQPATPPSRRSG